MTLDFHLFSGDSHSQPVVLENKTTAFWCKPVPRFGDHGSVGFARLETRGTVEAGPRRTIVGNHIVLDQKVISFEGRVSHFRAVGGC